VLDDRCHVDHHIGGENRGGNRHRCGHSEQKLTHWMFLTSHLLPGGSF
jgi:hypothetical protein